MGVLDTAVQTYARTWLEPAVMNVAAFRLPIALKVSSTFIKGQVVQEKPSTGYYEAYPAVAAPAAPTVSGTGSGSAFGAGTYLVQVSGVNARGETLAGPPAAVTLTAAQKIRVAAMSSLDASLTALNVYVDGTLIGTAAVSAGTSTQTDFDVATVTTAAGLPQRNTAAPLAIMPIACSTDSSHNITVGTTADPSGRTVKVIDAWMEGVFSTAELFIDSSSTVLDVATAKQLGTVVKGSVAAGLIHVR